MRRAWARETHEIELILHGSGDLPPTKPMKSLEIGPRVNQYLNGCQTISEQPKAYFCHRLSSSSQLSETPSSNSSFE